MSQIVCQRVRHEKCHWWMNGNEHLKGLRTLFQHGFRLSLEFFLSISPLNHFPSKFKLEQQLQSGCDGKARCLMS